MIDQTKRLVEKELPEHARPISIKTIEKMPVTPSGKIDYSALDEIAWVIWHFMILREIK